MATRTVEVANGVPALAPERAVTWPKRTNARLSNGLEVILAESHTIPKFHGELFFRSGNAAVADRSVGLAEMTATVVRTGTAKRASRQIEEDLRRIGVRWRCWIRRCTAEEQAECIANLCWKNRSPWRRMAALMTSSATTARRK